MRIGTFIILEKVKPVERRRRRKKPVHDAAPHPTSMKPPVAMPDALPIKGMVDWSGNVTEIKKVKKARDGKVWRPGGGRFA